jgi:hypothetical protein
VPETAHLRLRRRGPWDRQERL